MDVLKLREAQHACDRVQTLLGHLERNLPLPGEPSTLFAARCRLASDDIRTATVYVPDGGSVWVAFLDTIVDRTRIYDEVLRPLQELALRGMLGDPRRLLHLVPSGSKVDSAQDGARKLLEGNALIVSGDTMVAVDVESFPMRQMSEPSTEQSILGSKLGFNEEIENNVGALRHRLLDESLRIEMFTVGSRSHTRIALAYLDGVVNADLVELTRQGLTEIQTDFIRNSNDLREFLYGRSWTTLPLAEQTERVDRAAAAVATGRLCLLVDGTPFSLLVPQTLAETVQNTETALPGPVTILFVRILRVVGEFLSLAAPGLYAAVLTADTPLLPAPLALAVAASRTGVPYPVLTETLIMLVIIDVFTEATAQAPGGIGNTLSIVGTLIIGQMVVMAHLASSLMMIVVAATALGSFLTLKYPFSYTLRIWKYPITLLAGVAGLFGWMGGLLILLIHMASLKSAGVPYLSPIAPLKPRALFKYNVTQLLKPDLRFRQRTWNPRNIRRAGSRP